MSTTTAELVESVIEVTGASKAEAEHLLGACANDVEAAIALYFEQGSGSVPEAVSTAANTNTDSALLDENSTDSSDNVRAPIAPKREQLIGPEDDNFFAAAPSTGRISRMPQRVKVCPLRDFAREGALMEEELSAVSNMVSNGTDVSNDNLATSSSGSRIRLATRSSAMVVAARSSNESTKTSRLGDLFRPPVDISYSGTFQNARKRAEALKHWLLVNVQSDNFPSQVLNRDVWSHKEVRRLISKQFLLWQIDSESSEGRRFITFYHCAKLPYVCVIDPRTGEEVWSSEDPKESNMLTDLKHFLVVHKDFSQELGEEAPSTSKRPAECVYVDDDNVEQVNGSLKKRAKVMELTEEEQIALAIKNSMAENSDESKVRPDSASTANRVFETEEFTLDGSEGAESLEEFAEDEIKGACERIPFEQQLGEAKNEMTALKVRLFNAQGVDEMVQLRWPSDTKLIVLRHYIAQEHSHIPKTGYKLICAFPRKSLEAEHNDSTLKELGLHPSANLHITLDN